MAHSDGWVPHQNRFDPHGCHCSSGSSVDSPKLEVLAVTVTVVVVGGVVV